MSAQLSTQGYPAYSLPLPMPPKSIPGYPYTPSPYSISPPEDPESDIYSTTSAGASYSNPSTYNSHSRTQGHACHPSAAAASADSCDYESAASASGVDFQEYIHEQVSTAMDPLPMDRSMVTQAQTSGKLNDKHRQLLHLQKAAAARLARSRERYAQGLRDAREVQHDLQWTHDKVAALKSKAQRNHAKEYAKARARYPSPDEE